MKPKRSINALLGLIGMVILFHLLIMLKIIPFDATWGGRIQNDSEMYFLEIVSILIHLFLEFVLLMKGNFIKSGFKEKTTNLILWVYLGFFVLNTMANLLARTKLEQAFAALTFIFAVFIWDILNTKNHPHKATDQLDPAPAKKNDKTAHLRQ